MEKLQVAMNGVKVGEWYRSIQGATYFQYDESWLNSLYARPISLSLPLTMKPYSGEKVFNFFDNLLPDNPQIRQRIQQKFHVASNTPFDLLSAIGQDCIGAIQLYQNEPQTIQKVETIALTDRDIEKLLSQYQQYPLGMSDDVDFRISLAGAQEKTAFLWYQDKWHLPLHSTPTSHIFKLPIGVVGQGQLDLSQSCENEWLCLEIMKMFGLPVANAQLKQFGEVKVLVVERFDRRWSEDFSWLIRLPQEDMCQARGIASVLKYESDGGLGIIDIVGDILRGSSQASLDRKLFFKAQIIFWLLCAIDGHAKNFSVFLKANNHYQLTPFYDVISAYPLISPSKLQQKKIKMAMAWRGKNKHYLWHEIRPKYFYETAKLAGLSAEFVDDILHEIIQNYPRLEHIYSDKVPADLQEAIFAGIAGRMKILD